MRTYTRLLMLAGVALAAQAQPLQTALSAPPPMTKEAVGRWDAGLVERAAKILASPEQWNRADTRKCLADAKTFSIFCALEKSVEDSAGVMTGQPTNNHAATRTACKLHASADGQEGSCGAMFDEVPVFTISRVSGVTTGKWRADAEPSEVWAGKTTDAEYPVMEEAEKAVAIVTTKKYADPLADYNNDATTKFSDVQAFFQVLENQLVKNGTADLAENFDEVEIEIYKDGSGVARTYNGWFAVSGFGSRDSNLQFQIDTAQEVPPNNLDREILKRAAAIFTSDAVWNRSDNRKCPTTATTWSIYCAEERASIEVTGGFHHRRPALELVRELVDERTRQKSYKHRLMDYNNDPDTHLEDVKSLFVEAIARVK